MKKVTLTVREGLEISIGGWAYLSLLLLALVVLVIGYRKYRNPFLLVLYLAVSGAILFFDYLIYVWGKAYKYHPGFIEGKYDTHIGALVNAHILPSFAVLYIAFRCKWYWSFIFAVFFTGIELLFTQLGIFKSYWWHPGYTLVLLTFHFPIVKYWWKQLNQAHGKLLSFVTLGAVAYTIYVQLQVLLYGVLQIRTFHVNWFEHLHRDSSALNSITAIIFSSIPAFINTMNGQRFWYFLAAAGFISYEIVLRYVGVIKTEKIYLDSILSFCTFLIAMLVLLYGSKKMEEHNGRI
jgi:hypothetical protein